MLLDLVSETTATQVVTIDDAITTVEGVFAALHRDEATVFPVMMGHGPEVSNSFGVKSGVIASERLVGLKVGSYWPGNRTEGLVAHASTTILLDPATGYPEALIAASYLTALRTAASDGVASKYLSRLDSRTIAIIGAGHQAWFELLANIAVRPIERVLVWNRTPDAAIAFANRVRAELGLAAEAMPLDRAVSQADIVVTITAARTPLVTPDMVTPGTHISAMGSDSRGKQELASSLIETATLFADVIVQSVTIGDFERANDLGLITPASITPIGAVIMGDHPGRTSPEEITVYDSSGMALQDLAIGALALRAARRLGLVESSDLS